MATVRKFLDSNGFDWENGQIFWQQTPPNLSPGWVDFDDLEEARFIGITHPILDKEFSDDHGGPECPRIVAKDNEAIYFPVKYDGATWMQKAYLDLSKYENELSPYPGGG